MGRTRGGSCRSVGRQVLRRSLPAQGGYWRWIWDREACSNGPARSSPAAGHGGEQQRPGRSSPACGGRRRRPRSRARAIRGGAQRRPHRSKLAHGGARQRPWWSDAAVAPTELARSRRRPLVTSGRSSPSPWRCTAEVTLSMAAATMEWLMDSSAVVVLDATTDSSVAAYVILMM